MKHDSVLKIICSLLILLFVYTGISKLSQIHFFASQLNLYPIIKHFPVLLSWIIPLAELIIALLLTVPKYRLPGLYASVVLLTIFSLYLILMVTMHKNLPCSCGGVIQYMSWKQHIVFNIIFIALALTGLFILKRDKRWQGFETSN